MMRSPIGWLNCVTALVCLCTCPDEATAQAIARALVAERLAACVNVLPGVQSVYRWHGEVTRADEVVLLIKTVRDRLQALTARLEALHPYELPELVAVEVVGGLPAYLDWIAGQTRTGETDR
ncbi:MAG: divalent-cation tolerance protein CutA [Xanthomonadaceae bacterium]|nr:divalent-cation tolerance protein CutA [Xanthomonadaceae bacterium]